MTDREELPHEPYIDSVAHALAVLNCEPRYVHCETADGEQLDAVLSDWPEGVVSEEHWPHGVYLAWDQHAGWQLIESGGGRNVTSLCSDSDTYAAPWQVACDLLAQLATGAGADPIVSHGGPAWDPTLVRQAVDAWEAAL
ncbi:hypothetical protein GCM10027160_23620 [Streptomyces calidiresistens]|uniref:Uncharacterized protein n=1 Tax=Streptomyces calidiresistens TaxID=1485586 RepID=A0A7W3XXZ1_9ACTN|nr:hypothetical protein [Streptomyces calidiresistens]MBB0231276.1 hypothetical protein [Streptomyces calidiresistens]